MTLISLLRVGIDLVRLLFFSNLLVMYQSLPSSLRTHAATRVHRLGIDGCKSVAPPPLYSIFVKLMIAI